MTVIAGAGFGKTTALASWASETARGAEVAWFDAGAAEAAPGGVVGAVRTTLGLDEHHLAPAGLSPARPGGSGARSRAALASDRPGAQILILDNLQDVRSRRTLSDLDRLTRSVPDGVTLVLASRWEPLLHLSRLRAAAQVAEIGPEDLAMTPEEIGCVFEASGTSLSDGELAHLVDVTQGWPVAVRLACIAAEAGSSVEDLTVTDGQVGRIVARYLADEVFNRLPSEWQEVLTHTSILDEIHVDLARELAGNELAPTILEEVAARTGLFAPLPAAPGWFRPHELAQAYLRTTLQAGGPQRVADLHERAARWFTDRGDIASALPHAIRSHNAATIRSIVERTGLAALLCSDDHSIRIARAIATGPRDVWPNGRPLALAVAVLASADPPAAGALLAAVDPSALRSDEDRRLWAIARSKVLRNQARHDDARAVLSTAPWQGAQPTEQVLHDSEFALAGGSGDSYAELTHRAEAALMLARSIGADRPAVHLQVALSALALGGGEPRDAQVYARAAIAHGERFEPDLELEVAEARLICLASSIDLGEDPDSDPRFRFSPPATEPGAPIHLLVAGTTTDLHHRWRAGEAPRPLLDRLERVLSSVDLDTVYPGILFGAALLELRLAEASQDLQRVQQAATRLPGRYDELGEARLLRADEKRVRRAYRAGRDELRPIIRGEVPTLWEAVRLPALALDGVLAHLDDGPDTGSLQEAVALAGQTGRRGPFLDLGTDMYEALHARRTALPAHGGFVEELIDQLRRRAPTRLPQPLTHAEIRVPHHLESMATLEEIAAGLNLSRNTVKTHTAAIYRKLEVPSRREAVSQARALGLI